MYSMQLFFKSLILSPVQLVVCLRVFLCGQCECCCPGSGRPVLCCPSLLSGSHPVLSLFPKLCSCCTAALHWPGEAAMAAARPGLVFVMAGWRLTVILCCSASTGAWGPARWESRAEGVLQSEMEKSLGLCLLNGWVWRAKDQNLPKTTNVFVVN